MPAQKDYNDKFNIKLDYQFSGKLSSFLRISHRKMNNFEPPTISGPSGGDNNAYVGVLNQQLATGFTYTLSQAKLIEFRLGVSKTKAGKNGYNQSGPGMLELYGISGLPTDPRFAGGLLKQSVSGWTAFGRQESNPRHQDPFVWNPRINFSWIRGRMNWKAGYEYQAIATNIDDVHPKYGMDTYGGQFTRPSGAASDSTTYCLADFLLGLRSNYTIITPFLFNPRQRMHFFYIQDDWKVDPKLTLNLGLRYELGTPRWEQNNYLTYSPTSAQQVSSYPSYRPNITGNIYSSDKSVTNYFDKNTVVVPTDVSKPFGNAGRNIGRSDAFYQLDMGLHKDFRLFREENKLEFRAEFFNLFNKTNFQPASGNRSSSAFGTISGTFPARQIQFGFKRYF